jgi:hypothetical protein
MMEKLMIHLMKISKTTNRRSAGDLGYGVGPINFWVCLVLLLVHAGLLDTWLAPVRACFNVLLIFCLWTESGFTHWFGYCYAPKTSCLLNE